jgi:hypothetical protein
MQILSLLEMRTLLLLLSQIIIQKYNPMEHFLIIISQQTESSGVLKTATHRQLNLSVRKTLNIKHSLKMQIGNYLLMPSKIANSRVWL